MFLNNKLCSNLSNFLDWLEKKIYSEDKRFSLKNQDLIIYNHSYHKPELIFLLPEVFDIYHQNTGINPRVIQYKLKDALEINFKYTIVREGKIIEIFPCKKFFDFL